MYLVKLQLLGFIYYDLKYEICVDLFGLYVW